MQLAKDEICARIPHAGSMCLLHRIASWDPTAIVAYATSHRDGDNPLRSEGQLNAVCAVEYAAQAMAVHGTLLDRGEPRPQVGFLASVRELKLSVARLDDIADDLHILAQRLSGSDDSFIYAFELSAGRGALVTGRIAVRLMGRLR